MVTAQRREYVLYVIQGPQTSKHRSLAGAQIQKLALSAINSMVRLPGWESLTHSNQLKPIHMSNLSAQPGTLTGRERRSPVS